nr:MAG TPA: hypothetical protein [Caudoviricetes sp.]
MLNLGVLVIRYTLIFCNNEESNCNQQYRLAC